MACCRIDHHWGEHLEKLVLADRDLRVTLIFLVVAVLEPVMERREEHCECSVAALRFQDLFGFSIATVANY